MIEYVLDGRKFTFSYREIREEYYRFCQMTDEDFMKEIAGAAHLACVICFFKEIPTYIALSDIGIVHELVHMIHIPDGNTTSLREIRKLFEESLKLS